MIQAADSLVSLYLEDETAWLDAMSELAREGRVEALDLPNLAEFLADMAGRDRREVENRLSVLLAHLLKWDYQPDHRSRSWRATILVQRQELSRNVGRGVLRRHAIEVLADCYVEAIARAATETGIEASAFPPACPYTLDQALTSDLPEEP